MKMMKAMACLLALLMALLCMACAAPGSGATPSEVPAGEGEETAAADNSSIKVGLLCDVGGLGDESINDQAQAGMDSIKTKYGVQTQTAEPMEESEFLDMIQNFCDMDYNLIVCDAFSMADVLNQIAPKKTDKNFMILDTVVDQPNVMSFTYATHEGSFLAGVAAALKTKSNVVAFIGGMDIPTIQKFQVGYEEGVHYVNPDIQVIVKYIGSDNTAWNDPATAKSLTLDAIANGADVSYHAAGGSGLGMIEACVEKDIWAIGVNIDQAHLAPDNMLTSMLTRGDVAIEYATETLLNGGKISGHTVLNLETNGVGIVMNDFFTADEKAKIEQIRQKIIDGEIKVTDATAE